MLSKYARVSIVGVRQLSSAYLSRSQNLQDVNVTEHRLNTCPTVRFMSNSLAQDLLKAKQQESEQKKQNENDEDKDKGRKPLTKWQKIGFAAFGIFFTGSIVGNGILFSLPDQDEQGNNIEDEFSSMPFPKQHFSRLKNKIFKTKKEIEEPFSNRLLPDPLQEPYIQPKYTILVELTGLLVHSHWSHKHGWRFQKRPGLDLFLAQIGYPHFELVVYTVETPMTFHNVIDNLDPQNQFINYRLFRDATRFVNGHPTKDVSSLNRDPKKVILIDWNTDSVALGQDNALILKKWEGDTKDSGLLGLTQLLHTIKETDVDDVREVLSYYRQHEDPIEVFRENQRKYKEELAVIEEQKKEVKTPLVSGFSFMRRR